ncbi:imidazolonepropionase [Eisenibacter elegans]|uniref:imidazolonepropionase n=1 Tax=Eisenibacter elegans TaxID=997 RepID=UPI0003F54591|nr:imidazolonepropionase [Eisenibacter elegans]
MRIISGFSQILTLAELPLKGALSDTSLAPIENGAIVLDNNGRVVVAGSSAAILAQYPQAELTTVPADWVLLPAFVDCHTHICYAGSRAMDFAARNAGQSYLEIAQAGGGIWSTVQQTRKASQEDLTDQMLTRLAQLLKQGIGTVEVKSGYGLSLTEELKMLRAIGKAQHNTPQRLVPTCLAAHIKPRDFEGDHRAYLEMVLADLLPKVWEEGLARRVDIFVEKTAFDAPDSQDFIQKAQALGFDCTLHADQFTAMGAELAVGLGAVSADHLEASGEAAVKALAHSDTVAVVLPGASMGLGEPFAPARGLLDAGACVAIASDYNPGSAPMGMLLLQAAVLASYQKLSTAEVLAGLTYRAAQALRLSGVGRLAPGYQADMQAYACGDYREIVYQQGRLLPSAVWLQGQLVL